MLAASSLYFSTNFLRPADGYLVNVLIYLLGGHTHAVIRYNQFALLYLHLPRAGYPYCLGTRHGWRG